MDVTTFSPEQKAAIDKLIASPMGREALERAERERAAQRAEILARMRAQKTAAIRDNAVNAADAEKQRAIVAERRQALFEAEAALIASESAASAASFTVDRVQTRAWWDLEKLGTEAIERTRVAVRWAEHEARNAMGFRLEPVQSHWLFGPGDPVLSDRDQVLNRHVDRMLEIVKELDAMLFDDALTPQQIEDKCKAFCKEAEMPRTYVAPTPETYAVQMDGGSVTRPRKAKAA